MFTRIDTNQRGFPGGFTSVSWVRYMFGEPHAIVNPLTELLRTLINKSVWATVLLAGLSFLTIGFLYGNYRQNGGTKYVDLVTPISQYNAENKHGLLVPRKTWRPKS